MPGMVMSIVNNKGGVGKTTVAVNLAHALTRRGQRVLVIDMDSQCNATSILCSKDLVLQRGFEMWCNAARQSCMEGGQHDGPDRDHAQDGLGDPRYRALGGGVARLSRHLQPVVSAA